jgi:hypothetical protein
MQDELKPASPLPWASNGVVRVGGKNAPKRAYIHTRRGEAGGQVFAEFRPIACKTDVTDDDHRDLAYLLHAANNHARLQARVAELEAALGELSPKIEMLAQIKDKNARMIGTLSLQAIIRQALVGRPKQ